MSISGDNYSSSNINAVIKFLKEDMDGHLKQIERLNKMAITYIEYEKFTDYIVDEIIKEYKGYRESKKQYQSYIKVRVENLVKGNVQ